jgi:hypothetical protein
MHWFLETLQHCHCTHRSHVELYPLQFQLHARAEFRLTRALLFPEKTAKQVAMPSSLCPASKHCTRSANYVVEWRWRLWRQSRSNSSRARCTAASKPATPAMVGALQVGIRYGHYRCSQHDTQFSTWVESGGVNDEALWKGTSCEDLQTPACVQDATPTAGGARCGRYSPHAACPSWPGGRDLEGYC